MSTVKCRYCHKEVRKGDRHQCAQMQAARQPSQIASDDNSNFFVSLLVAEATDNWMLGALAGGNIVGAIIGQGIADDDKKSTNTETREQVVEQAVEQAVETPSESESTPDCGSSSDGGD